MNSRNEPPQLLVSNLLRKLPLGSLRLTPLHGGQGETEEWGSHSRLTGGSFNKQENLHTRFDLGEHKMNPSFYLSTCQILEVARDTLTRFCHVYHPGGLNTLLSQGYVFGAASGSGEGTWTFPGTFPDQRSGWEASDCWGPAFRLSGVTFSQWPPPTSISSLESPEHLNIYIYYIYVNIFKYLSYLLWPVYMAAFFTRTWVL